jgi:hypothetical protein
MRIRSVLFAAPFCVVAIMANVAGATPSGAEQSQGPKLDKLHAVRPIAATSSVLAPNQNRSVEVGTEGQPADSALATPESTAAVAAPESTAAVAAPESTAAPAASSEPVSSPVVSSSDPGPFLACVRNRESGGDYSVHNEGDSGASGAYQFLPGTWDSIAASVGRFDLVGVDPAQASPADQDAMAQALYAQQGAAPWGGGCS